MKIQFVNFFTIKENKENIENKKEEIENEIDLNKNIKLNKENEEIKEKEKNLNFNLIEIFPFFYINEKRDKSINKIIPSYNFNINFENKNL